MGIYNKFTKNANITVTLAERDGWGDKSIWEVILNNDITEVGRTDGKIVKAGEKFKCDAEYDAKEEDVISYIQSRGLLDSCGVSDAEFERLLEDDDNMTEITVAELEELRHKAAKYDEMIAARRRGAEATNSVSAEVRSARAKKAAEALWARKCG